MPIYEYRCAKCGVFDVMQKITENALRKCPTCKGKVTKLMSSTAFQLKGTGWYVTDYAGKGKGTAAGEAKEGKSEAKDAKVDGASGATTTPTAGASASDASSKTTSTGSTKADSSPA